MGRKAKGVQGLRPGREGRTFDPVKCDKDTGTMVGLGSDVGVHPRAPFLEMSIGVETGKVDILGADLDPVAAGMAVMFHQVSVPTPARVAGKIDNGNPGALCPCPIQQRGKVRRDLGAAPVGRQFKPHLLISTEK